MTKKEKLIKKGKRIDGRGLNDLRPIEIEVGVLERADGSAYLEWGGNKALAAVYGPQECLPRHLGSPYQSTLVYRYNMAPFSVEDRKRPGPDRRSSEISKVSREALEEVILLEQFPNSMIKVFCEVLQAAAGTRCASLTAASVALADAGIPMKDLVASCAAGKVDGKLVLDLGKKEDNLGEADVPLAITPHQDKIVLLQMDGNLSKKELKKCVEMAKKGCKEVYKLQKQALKQKYEEKKPKAEVRTIKKGKSKKGDSK